MFQNCRKSLISQSQHCERSEVRLHFGQKFIKNAKNGQFGEFLKTEAGGLTVLPDRSILMRQKLVENAKIQMRHFE